MKPLLALLAPLVLVAPACDALRNFGPERAEREAMEVRQEEMLRAGSARTISVFPVRIHRRVDPEAAVELAELLAREELGVTRALADGPWFELRPSVNEQSPLWELARKVREHVRANPPETDYALYADYMLNEETGRVFAVHFVVCDREGEWVQVHFHNSHHSAFREIEPSSRTDCARLVAAGLRD